MIKGNNFFANRKSFFMSEAMTTTESGFERQVIV